MMIEIYYGSETGNTNIISHILYDLLPNPKKISPFNSFSLTSLDTQLEQTFIFLVSTTGNGDFPENARLGWKRLLQDKKKYKPPTNSPHHPVNYLVAGFGDTNYNSFCHTAKCLNRVLKRIPGFKELTPATFFDAADLNQTEKIEDWLDTIALMLH